MARILIVEDAEELLELVADFFRSKGTFDVDTAPDGNKAIRLISENDYDIAILDIMLPGANGFEVCKALRGKSNCPIAHGKKGLPLQKDIHNDIRINQQI